MLAVQCQEQQLVKDRRSKDPAGTPNTEMSQGHYTMELLAEMIRRVSGKTLPEFAKERIFG